MKYTLLFIITLFMLACSNHNDKKEVRACFDRYKMALMSDRGNAAAACIDSNTVKYYDEIQRYAVYYDSMQLMRLPVMDLVYAMLIRKEVPADTLVSMDGRALFAYALHLNGFIDKDGLIHYNVGRVTINGNIATAALIHDSSKIPVTMLFFKEYKSWKIDLVDLLNKVEQTFEQQMRENDKTKKDIVDNWLQDMSAEEQARIWRPVRKKTN